MAHEVETALFVGEPAWHGLGVVLPGAPSIDEALVQAGLDWRVELAPLQLSSGRAVETHRAVLRDSDGAILGVVGQDYTPLQNDRAFEWFRPVVDSGEVTIEAAGALRGGRRVWILGAVRNGTVDVVANDPVKSYVLLAHGHDGSLAVRCGFTSTRVVCANTLAVATAADVDRQFKFKHTSGIELSLERAREAFDYQRAQLRDMAGVYRELARRRLSQKNLTRYVRESLKAGAGNDDTIKVRGVEDIIRLAEPGVGRGVTRPGTLWAGLNAVTEWATHQRGRSQEARVDATWFGAGGDLARRALDVAVAYAEKLPIAA